MTFIVVAMCCQIDTFDILHGYVYQSITRNRTVSMFGK